MWVHSSCDGFRLVPLQSYRLLARQLYVTLCASRPSSVDWGGGEPLTWETTWHKAFKVCMVGAR